MRFSTEFDKIVKALFDARQMFVKVKKGRVNSHLNSKFANLDDVLAAIDPALTEIGVYYTQDQALDMERKTMTVETRFIHVETGQWVEYSFTLPIEKFSPQAGGSTNSYARRYALCTHLGLSTADDDAHVATKNAQDWKKELDQCETITDLQETFKTAYKQSDAANRVIIKEHYDKLKAKLDISTARGFNPAAPAANVAKNEKVESKPQQEVKSQSIADFE